jgi:hypothetical protein
MTPENLDRTVRHYAKQYRTTLPMAPVAGHVRTRRKKTFGGLNNRVGFDPLLSKKSKIEEPEKSHKNLFSAASSAASRRLTCTKSCGGFLMGRCGPATLSTRGATCLRNSSHLLPVSIKKGDVIIVPAGSAHWYKEVTTPITYLEVRFVPPK